MVCSAVSAFPLAIHDLLLQTLACSLLLWMHTRNCLQLLHPQSQCCAFLHLWYHAALASVPCWVGAQDRSSCSWGRNQGGKNVWKACGSPVPGLAGSMVRMLPALHWREESSAGLCGLRLMDTLPSLPEIWRGLGLLAQQAS